MLCPKCGKESKNLRVCAFCHAPFPTGRSAQAGNPRATRARLSPAIRWGVIGLLAAITVGYYLVGRERAIPVGVVIPNLIAGPMSPGEANVTLKTINGTAQVDVRDGELFVRIGAAAFPERRDGQLALAQQYARADEIVQGRKRAISFLDPGGNQFARADPAKGVAMTR
jgi:hypothetical protein